MTDDGYCAAIGAKTIALLHWDGEAWTECAPRIPGFGFPSIVHYTGKSIWIELGLDLAARLRIENGMLKSQVFDDFSWDRPSWVNVGWVDDIVVLTGPERQRVFFDEQQGRFVEAPELRAQLDSAQFQVRRVRKDKWGVLWGTYQNGLLKLDPNGSGQWENPIPGGIRDRYPLIHLLGEDDVWLSTQYAVYHVDRKAKPPVRADVQPILVSIVEGRSSQQLYSAGVDDTVPQRVPFAKNHLILQFFARTYTTAQSHSYRFPSNADRTR
jgi:hypothetical protein